MSAMPASASRLPDPIVDRELHTSRGIPILVIGVALIAVSSWMAYIRFDDVARVWIILGSIVVVIALKLSLVALQPNESLVCLLFGHYVGTEHRSGFWCVNPLYTKNKISRRLETLESGPLKVNDAIGNPIEISAVIVWRVENAAKARFEVASYKDYVRAQSETALRRMASEHPYDVVEADEALAHVSNDQPGRDRAIQISGVTLRDGGDAITETLLREVRTRMEPIGISVVEARISHLAYSSEIAGAMLRKQAAGAVVAARRLIVKGAVSIVDEALKQLDEKNLADVLDPERKAAMISNLLVVLVADREVTPVINTGTLYS